MQAASCVEKIKAAVADPIVYTVGEVSEARSGSGPLCGPDVMCPPNPQGWSDWGAVRNTAAA